MGTQPLPALPALVLGDVRHQRPGPVRHGFSHRVYQWLVDLDDLPDPPWYLRPFASFRAADHLGDPGRSIKANVEHYLGLHGIRLGAGGRVLMLANARVLGHVFDPLTVFWCFGADGGLACVVAEVHNTYGERHGYVVEVDDQGAADVGKEFYVSPFFGVFGDYQLKFVLGPAAAPAERSESHSAIAQRNSDRSAKVGAFVTLKQEGRVVFTGSFTGVAEPVTLRRMLGVALTQPLMPQRVAALIRLHGVWLWLRRLPVVRRLPHREQPHAR